MIGSVLVNWRAICYFTFTIMWSFDVTQEFTEKPYFLNTSHFHIYRFDQSTYDKKANTARK